MEAPDALYYIFSAQEFVKTEKFTELCKYRNLQEYGNMEICHVTILYQEECSCNEYMFNEKCKQRRENIYC